VFAGRPTEADMINAATPPAAPLDLAAPVDSTVIALARATE
jgi:hypothetical protein